MASEGTQALFTGLATQVIYGGCDADTAEFYSKASGTATTDANTDDPNSHLRQRPLLTVDEVITPQVGNCTIFARYVEAGFATQVVLNARLTRFYERDDWKRRLNGAKGNEPLLLERGIDFDDPELETPEPPAAEPIAGSPSSIAVAFENVMQAKVTKATNGKVKTVPLSHLRGQYQRHRQERTR